MAEIRVIFGDDEKRKCKLFFYWPILKESWNHRFIWPIGEGFTTYFRHDYRHDRPLNEVNKPRLAIRCRYSIMPSWKLSSTLYYEGHNFASMMFDQWTTSGFLWSQLYGLLLLDFDRLLFCQLYLLHRKFQHDKNKT
jgi:hypothetical protein